ncbi:hypothetical protein [Parasphingorhabdus pacifica]
MNETEPIRDIRFEGMDTAQLLDWIGKIKEGHGPESMHDSVDALERAVQVVVDLDETLRVELGKLSIAWEGNAGTIAQEATKEQVAAMREAQQPLAASVNSVRSQGEGYSSARHSLPDPGEMRNQESENVAEWAGGAFGYESDYDAAAKQADQQKHAARAVLGSYRDTTVDQADRFRPMPELAPAPVTAQAASSNGAGYESAGGAVGASVGGSGGFATAGSGEPRSDAQGGAPHGQPATPPDDDDGAAPHGGENTGEREAGIHDGGTDPGRGADGDGGGPAPNSHDDPEAAGTSVGTVLGIGAGGAAVAGIGAVAAGKLLGGPAAGTTPPGGGNAGNSVRGGSSGIGGGPGDTTAGRTTSAAPTGKPSGGALMGPAATRGARQNTDDEHENRYGADETPFDDNRHAAPPVLGSSADEDNLAGEEQKAADEVQQPGEERPPGGGSCVGAGEAGVGIDDGQKRAVTEENRV